MRDIGASVEVRALIGADKLRQLHGHAFARYECWQCGREGRTAGQTAALQHGQQVRGAGRQLRGGENHLAKKCPA
jgi:hypothetical protein